MHDVLSSRLCVLKFWALPVSLALKAQSYLSIHHTPAANIPHKDMNRSHVLTTPSINQMIGDH